MTAAEPDTNCVVVALGGNALLRRGEAMTSDNQRQNVVTACEQLAPIALRHDLVISHGNGPQVGLLALQNAAYDTASSAPLDVLGAQTQGMIGYLVAQEMANLMPTGHPIACLLTMIEIDPDDPAFQRPTKPIGPVYGEAEAHALAEENGWDLQPDGAGFRRVVASPKPVRILEMREIRWLLDHGSLVICAGGGGIPVAAGAEGRMIGVEAVIDKDRASQVLATNLHADIFVMATDTDAAYLDWSLPEQRAIVEAHPAALRSCLDQFGEGSMRPKIEAACDFATSTGHRAIIGSLADITSMMTGDAGTIISTEFDPATLRTT